MGVPLINIADVDYPLQPQLKWRTEYALITVLSPQELIISLQMETSGSSKGTFTTHFGYCTLDVDWL